MGAGSFKLLPPWGLAQRFLEGQEQALRGEAWVCVNSRQAHTHPLGSEVETPYFITENFSSAPVSVISNILSFKLFDHSP